MSIKAEGAFANVAYRAEGEAAVLGVWAFVAYRVGGRPPLFTGRATVPQDFTGHAILK